MSNKTTTMYRLYLNGKKVGQEHHSINNLINFYWKRYHRVSSYSPNALKYASTSDKHFYRYKNFFEVKEVEKSITYGKEYISQEAMDRITLKLIEKEL